MAGVPAAPRSVTVDCTDIRATERLGRAFAEALAVTESGPLLVTLSGELGAGKTTLVRAILRALGHVGPVPSPTYTLLEQYAAGGWDVAHLDFYRLRGAADLESLGVRDLFAGRRLILVEWPENAAGGLPAADVAVAIALPPGGRSMELRTAGPTGESLLAGITQRMAIKS
jgi:tRNA threonylcarbamoyladenosine biosynthesis protein TsaE